MTYQEVQELTKKLDTWEGKKNEMFIIAMPKSDLIF